MEQNIMVPYESIDPVGAAKLRPGVHFLVSTKTVLEVLVQRGLRSQPGAIVAEPGSDTAPEAAPSERTVASPAGDSRLQPAEIERAFAALQMADENLAWEVYRHMGELLKAQIPKPWPASGPNMEKTDAQHSPGEIELAFAALHTADKHQAWDVYHRIGDVLRAAAAPRPSPDFSEDTHRTPTKERP